MSIFRTGFAALVMCGVFAPGAVVPAVARDAGLNAISDFSGQERQRPRIRIQREQPAAWPYPRPDDYSWPAPGPAYRQCEDWYQTEYRPSGTVITPQMRCRWVRG